MNTKNKTIHKITMLLLFGILLISCANTPKKEVAPTKETFLTAIVDAKDVAATIMVLAIKTEVSGIAFNTIVAEDKTNGYTFSLYHKVVAEDAPQEVNDANQAFSIGHNDVGYIATQKNLKFEITKESDTHLEGTFSFIGKVIGGSATTTVTNGKFRAKKRGWN